MIYAVNPTQSALADSVNETEPITIYRGVKALKNDKAPLLHAATATQRASDYILNGTQADDISVTTTT